MVLISLIHKMLLYCLILLQLVKKSNLNLNSDELHLKTQKTFLNKSLLKMKSSARHLEDRILSSKSDLVHKRIAISWYLRNQVGIIAYPMY